jgi:hypothetical protein
MILNLEFRSLKTLGSWFDLLCYVSSLNLGLQQLCTTDVRTDENAGEQPKESRFLSGTLETTYFTLHFRRKRTFFFDDSSDSTVYSTDNILDQRLVKPPASSPSPV